MNKLVPIQRTDWFDSAFFIPARAGVYEVTPTVISSMGHTVAQFSYWHGSYWGPVMPTISDAFAVRFDVPRRSTSFDTFRGLTEQA